MRPSQLQLLENAFSKISVVPTRDYEPGEGRPSTLVYPPNEYSIKTRVIYDEAEASDLYLGFTVFLDLKVVPLENKKIPYEIDESAIGAVRILTPIESDKEELRKIAVVNGVSLLFGAIKELVLTLTCRSLNGPFMLPTLNFIDIAKDDKLFPPKENVKKSVGRGKKRSG